MNSFTAGRRVRRNAMRHGASRLVLSALFSALCSSVVLAQEPVASTGTAAVAEGTMPAPAAAAAEAAPAAAAVAAEPSTSPASAATPPRRVHVVYFPEEEKARIRDEIRQEVMGTIARENWLEAGAVPEWMRRVKFSGDITLRGQGDFLHPTNDAAIHFNAINSGSPVDIFLPAGGSPQKVLTIPYLNTTRDRQSLKLRARLAMDTVIDERISVGMLLATGSTANPVSTTQNLGHEFNKNAFLLDRAFVRYQSQYHVTLTAGRMANPWQANTDVIWDRDVNLDGLALRLKPALAGGINPWLSLGAFPFGQTDANFPASSPFKAGSRDKWLYGAQFGMRLRVLGDLQWRSTLALYDFSNIEGRLSSSCYAPTSAVPCDSDHTRPGFMQKGNTLFALRDLDRPNPATDPEFQYFGLASGFQVASLNLSLEKPLDYGRKLQFDAELAQNLAFNAGEVSARVPVNNFAPCPASNANCVPRWEGGDLAWQLQVRYGHEKVNEIGRWDAFFGYRYVESDAVVDAFTDSDFHLGGSNAQGYYIGSSVAVRKNTVLAGKYLSASEVSGFRFEVDVLQLELQARF